MKDITKLIIAAVAVGGLLGTSNVVSQRNHLQRLRWLGIGRDESRDLDRSLQRQAADCCRSE
jgi:hypothetical protein